MREPNTNKIRSSSLKYDNTKLLVDENWKTINQNGGIESFTSDFSVTLSKKLSVISSHIKNQTIHVTEEEKEKIQSIDGLNTHVSTNSLHWQESDRTDITNLKSHVDDNIRHVSATQTEKWDNAATEIPTLESTITTVKTDVERLLQSHDEFFTTQYDGTEAPTNGKSSARCIQLSSAHFTLGVIKEIQIPYYGGQSVTGYLCVQIFFENETNDTIKELEECYFSNNTQTQSGDGSCVYQFDNLVIPAKYKFIRLMIVPNKETAPNIKVNVDSCPEFRMRCLSKDSSFNFDDDDCLIWTGSQNQTNYLSLINCIKVISPLNELNNIISIINELQSEVATLRSELDELKGNSTI